MDQRVLLEHAIPTLGLDFAASSLLQVAEGLAAAKVTDRFNGIAAAIGAAIRGRDEEERIFRAVATHRSDIVRIWACLSARHNPRPGFVDRLRKARPFAADGNMSVREFAIDIFRSFLVEDPKPGLAILVDWAGDPDPNVRRCAVEGTRPRGVWTPHIPALKRDPGLALPLLEPVRADASRYVQNAVANWTQPEWAIKLCRRWRSESPAPATAYIVKRALLSLRKRGFEL